MVRYSRVNKHRRKGLNVKNYVRRARKRTAHGNSGLIVGMPGGPKQEFTAFDIGKGFSGRSEPVVERVSISHKRLPIIENGRIIGWEQG